MHKEALNPPLPTPIVNQITTTTQTPNLTNSAPTQSPTNNGIPQFSPKPVPRMPVPTKSSAPIVLTAKPVPIPKNLVNLRKPE